MKPTHERNQEWLPPKKRELPVNSSSGGSTEEGLGSSGGTGGEAASTPSSGSAASEVQTGSTSGEWMRVQPGLQYSVDNSDGVSVPVDQYGMVYKVAVPSVTYSPTSLHPVLSHISPAYTVPSPLLQHPGIPYHPLGYAQIPHPSLQFVGSSYAVPYAVPPGFVPSPLISPQSAIPQPHHVSHLVPYPSVIQEGMVSPPPQPPTSVHTLAKAVPPGSVPLVMSPDQAAQPHVFYHHPGSRTVAAAAASSPAVTYGDSQGTLQERRKEVNGGEAGRGVKEQPQDSSSRGARVLQIAQHCSTSDQLHARNHASFQTEGRGSPGQSSTPDTDLEVQQVVGCLASPNQGGTGSRKEVSFGPLNLSQGSLRSREAPPVIRTPETSGSSRTAYVAHLSASGDPRVSGHQAVMLANGQQVLVPLDFTQPQQYASPPSEVAGAPKPSDPAARMCLPEQPQLTSGSTSGPSHFMKGAIIQLATGELKRVEDLQTQDFVRSAEASGGLKIDSSMVVDIRQSQQRPGLVSLHFSVGEQQSRVTIDVPPEHPFFVFGQGWSSCSPERTAQLYGLTCHHLQAGDVCVSITLQQPQHQHPQQQAAARTPAKSKPSSAVVVSQAMGPPAPQHPRPPAQFWLDRTHRDRDEEPKEEAVDGGGAPPRPDRPLAEHSRSQRSYYLHTEAQGGTGAAAQRRWSVPGYQRYASKGEEEAHPSASGPSRPTFIPQEVKLSIEGRSNAGK
ncbi:ataxin-1-like [Arapaima gigas]